MKYSNDNWTGFKGDVWRDEINVRDFIQSNYTPYEGEFLDAFIREDSQSMEQINRDV